MFHHQCKTLSPEKGPCGMSTELQMGYESPETSEIHCRMAGAEVARQLFIQLYLFSDAETPGTLGTSSKVYTKTALRHEHR